MTLKLHITQNLHFTAVIRSESMLRISSCWDTTSPYWVTGYRPFRDNVVVSSSKGQNVQEHFDISTLQNQTITLSRNVGKRWPGEAASIPLHRCENPQNLQKYWLHRDKNIGISFFTIKKETFVSKHTEMCISELYCVFVHVIHASLVINTLPTEIRPYNCYIDCWRERALQSVLSLHDSDLGWCV